jgi:RimJ/RimL family protein N-acetyltransferase
MNRHPREAQRLLVDYLFAHTQVNRVEAVAEITNTSEQWALEKAGFTREGVLRGYGFRGGAWRDAIMYSVLREEAGDGSADRDVTELRPSRRARSGTRRDG